MGFRFRLLDTAGIRETQDEVEKMGVDLARNALEASAAVLFVVDASEPLSATDEGLHAEILALQIPIVYVANKCDLPRRWEALPFAQDAETIHGVSAETMQGLPELEHSIAVLLKGDFTMQGDEPMLNRLHQKDSLRRAIEALKRLEDNYQESPEFMSIDINEALDAVGEITGETTPDDVLEAIFNTFCIGKIECGLLLQQEPVNLGLVDGPMNGECSFFPSHRSPGTEVIPDPCGRRNAICWR